MTHAQRGFALLIVLWSVVLLALLATGMTAAGRTDLQLAGNLRRAAAAEAAADGGIEAAVFHMTDIPAAAWDADAQPHGLRIGAFAVSVQVRDENAKINPNYAPPTLMAALLRASGSDPSRADSIAQAVTEWQQPGLRDPIIQRYRAAGMTAAPTGAPFQSVAELGLVIGMTPQVLAQLAPHLSVYATGPLQIARADPVVQAVMRSIDGGQPPAPTTRARVLNITADASGPDGSRAIRHAVIALGRETDRQPFRTLLWESLPAG